MTFQLLDTNTVTALDMQEKLHQFMINCVQAWKLFIFISSRKKIMEDVGHLMKEYRLFFDF